ncbi:thioesterase superfamily protein [Acidianus hospitalis W1]|uniref:Thioesterase superfamily protein n=1 Tax=Acidianus hospitalis (strain W1) TaxID=933801 RepID=F4B684_ACIHW|nr:hotdog domain-containing protein [Acidianus hospitalis]AEE93372.1 thioesterase superfamily protein [Acidianus hospitalis W1]
MKLSDTKVRTQNIVHYEQTNFMGRLHGGDMLKFLVDTGMLSAIKVAKATSVIASLDNVVFKKGANLGDIIEVEAYVAYVGNTSMEVEMSAYRGDEKIVTATGVYVKIDENFRPQKVGEIIECDNEEEKAIIERAKKRRQNRIRSIKNNEDQTKGLRFRITNGVYISPDLTYDGKIISAGKLLKMMDDLGGSLALKFIGYKGYDKYSDTVVTVAISNMSFYSPIKLGDIIEINAGLTYVGRTSLDVLINVFKNGKEKVTEAYFSYVRVDNEGKPKEMPRYYPETEVEKNLWQEAIKRRNLQIKEKKL